MSNKIGKILSLSLILLAFSISAFAQKNAKKTVASSANETMGREETNYANLLPATAKLMFIDSVVVDIDKVYDNIFIASSCGRLKSEKKSNGIDYSYTNDFNTVRYLSVAEKNGTHKLYMQQRIGRTWTELKKVDIEGGLTDIICPYLMPDGVTLYFAARGGEDNVGGHDLFYTVYDSDSHTFYRPQSLGLPYNSMSDDVCCVIDDVNNIGHLVTMRNQPNGKACIYTFETTASREIYDADSTPIEKLASFASIRSIKDTQTDTKALASAKSRLENVRNESNGNSAKDFSFVINGKKTYHRISDFKSATNAERFMTYSNRLAELKQSEALLASMRLDYHNGDKSKANDILSLEEAVMKERKELSDLEKQIRNAELLK